MKNPKVVIGIAVIVVLGAGATLFFGSRGLGLKGSFIINDISDKGDSKSAPESISFQNPGENQNLDLAKVKSKGLPFTVNDPNTESHSRDASGTFHMNYKWELSNSSGKSVWSAGWVYDSSKITLPSACIVEFVGLPGKYMICPGGTIPASFFNSIDTGSYTLTGTTGDGKISSDPTSVTFTIGGSNSNSGSKNYSKASASPTGSDSATTTHQAVIDTFKTGLLWNLEQAGNMDQDGNYTHIYKIYLNDEARKKLAYTNDNKFYFRYVYKPYWGSKAGQLIKSEMIDFNMTPGKGLNSTSKNKYIKPGDGEIYVAITLPWPGLATGSELAKYGKDNWGKYDVDFYFYDASEATGNEKQIAIASTYRTEKIDRPELYLNANSSGCIGIGDWDFQVANSGGPLPYNEYKRILLYVSGDGYGPKNLDDSFGTKAISAGVNIFEKTIFSIHNAVMALANSIPQAELFVSRYYGRDVMEGRGAKSDWECHDAGNGNLWLVRDTTKGDTTIFHTKVNP